LYWKLKINPSNYKDSLLRFVKVYGPIAQKVATKILEGLKFKQLSNGNTFTSNIVKRALLYIAKAKFKNNPWKY